MNNYRENRRDEPTTHYVDENYVDTSANRNAEFSTDSRDFYGHRVDAANTIVSNTYDTNAIQNTIGTRGHIFMDPNIDTTDLVYSNDRNYGKTGWNGHFTYEQPQQSKHQEKNWHQEPQKPCTFGSPAGRKEKETKKSPHELPAAGMRTKRDEWGKRIF